MDPLLVREAPCTFKPQGARPIYNHGSDVVRLILANELILECTNWDPISSLDKELSALEEAELELIGPQFSVAVGAALAAM